MISNTNQIFELSTEDSVRLIENLTTIKLLGSYAFDAIDRLAKRYGIDYVVEYRNDQYRVKFHHGQGFSRPCAGYYEADTLGRAFRVAFLRWWYQL
jgi:hypothetical protein